MVAGRFGLILAAKQPVLERIVATADLLHSNGSRRSY
jgi:hypothetical protein